MVDIRLGKYPPHTTHTEENSCFSIYHTVKYCSTKGHINAFLPATITIFSGANRARAAWR